MVVPTLVAAALLSLAQAGPAVPEHPRGYVCRLAPGPIVVDGKLDDAAWAKAPWTEEFVDIEGDLKPKPRFKTRAKMLWDREFLYIAAELLEPHVWGTLTKHDSVIFQDNDFEVFIDPDGDNHDYGEIEINALNTEWDLFLPKPYRDGGPAIDAWEIPGLKKGVAVDGTLNDPGDVDRAWTVELAIPWSVWAEKGGMPTPPRDGDRWRINFSRVEWRHEIIDGAYRKVEGTKEDNWVWSPQGVIDMHRPETWGYLQFTTRDGEVAFKPDPTYTARSFLMSVYWAQREFQKSNGAWAKSLAELGLSKPGGLPEPRFEATGDGYRVSMTGIPGAEGTLTLLQDSRLRLEQGRPR